MMMPEFDRISSKPEPIAIIGLACRLPGRVKDPDGFWALLMAGRHGIRSIPPDRWSLEKYASIYVDAPGKTVARRAGIVDGYLEFDAGFFEIPPKEAEAMDPQQRLLLQLVWEALEDSGQSATRLRGSDTAVYVGISASDYSHIKRMQPTLDEIYAASGTVLSIAANRISHRFDWHGPSVAVDTACSSSLIATDLACRAIWQGNSQLAVAAGVNALFDTAAFSSFSRAHMLSPTGRIRSFDARADGYVRGEGGGVVVLKPLSAALRDRDRIYAVVRGSASNQDGFTPSMTAPNPAAQEALIRATCAAAQIDPAEIAYVETHGTGTLTGDPAEALAIGRAIGQARPRLDPVLLGAVKPNIGHLESGSGIAGLIKAALVIERGTVPPNIGFGRPNPAIAFDDLNLRVPTKATALHVDNGAPVVLVNSFGFGGANACVVLSAARSDEVPAKPRGESTDHRPLLFPVSANDADGLRRVARDLHRHIAAMPADRTTLEGIAHSLAVRRAHLAERAVLRATNRNDLLQGLRALSSARGGAPVRGQGRRAVWRGRAQRPRRVAFVFSGQGAQWAGMGRDLLRSDRAFRDAVDAFDRLLKPHTGWSVAAQIEAADPASLERTDIAQATIFALQAGLVAHWRARGVEPAAVFGHSLGEVAAAWVAGALSLSDAALLVFHRGRLMERTAGQGRMIAVGLSVDEVFPFIADSAAVSIAAFNSDRLVTLSGPREDMLRVETRLKAELADVSIHLVNRRYAWHSVLVEPLKPDFFDAVANIAAMPSDRFISTVTGATHAALETGYWWRNMREPVRYSDAVRSALALDCDVFVEIGPRETLTGLNRAVLREAKRSGDAIPSMSRSIPGEKALEDAFCRLHVAGAAVDWALVAPRDGAFVKLPGYPWQNRKYELRIEEADRLLRQNDDHPLLGQRQPVPHPAWQKEISLRDLRYLDDHTIGPDVIFPAAGYLEMMWSATALHHGCAAVELEDLECNEPLVLTRDNGTFIRTELDPVTGWVAIFGRRRNEGEQWSLHASATGRPCGDGPRAPAVSPQRAPASALDNAAFYTGLGRLGWSYGPSFRGVESVWARGPHIHGRAAVPRPAKDGQAKGYRVHPALLDSLMQVVLAPFVGIGAVAQPDGDTTGPSRLFAPWRAKRIRFFRPFPASASVVIGDRTLREGRLTSDGVVFDARGNALCSFDQVTARQIAHARADGAASQPSPGFYVERLVPVAGPGSNGNGGEPVRRKRKRVALAGDRCERADALAAALARHGATVDRVATACDATVHVISLSQEHERLIESPSDTLDELTRCCAALARQVRAMAGGARLWVVAPLAGPGAAEEPARIDPLAEALRGFARCIRTEHPEHKVSLILADAAADPVAIAARIMEDGAELEIAMRSGSVLAPRLEQVRLDRLRPATGPVSALGVDGNFRLALPVPGLMDGLAFEAMARPRAGAGEVVIRVEAVSLNFRDLMAATGLLPEGAEGPSAHRVLGLECAGVVVDSGDAANGVRVGSRVVALQRGAARRFVAVAADRVFPVPDGISFAHAAAIPSAFLTAHYALHELARIAPGERVLIHNAAGGVGSAAVALARAARAEIFATAGSEAKRDWLRAQGVRHVFDSRSLDFADAVRAIVGDDGIDVVVNALAGAYIDKSLSLLGSYGRFVELGKRDVHENRPIGLRALSRNISVFVVDLLELFDKRPRIVRLMYDAVLASIADGRLALPEVTIFPASDVANAFRRFQDPAHIGKIVVTLDDPDLRVGTSGAPEVFVRAGGIYVVTGGNRGFGLAVALWLAEHGAGTLYLVSRSGRRPSGAGADAALARRLAKTGARVVSVALDIADRGAVGSWIDRLASDGIAVHGIVHAAVVYDDGFVTQLDADRIEKVLAPKVAGAINLRALARANRLDFLLLFSSFAQQLGDLAQANYAAANAFLGGFAAACRDEGIPALAIDWGAIGEVGLVARSAALRRYMEMSGVESIPVAAACAALPVMASRDVASIACVRIDWERFGRLNRQAHEDPRLAGLFVSSAQRAPGQLRPALAMMRASQKYDAVLAFLRDQLSKVIGVDRGDLPATEPLNRSGLDSLSAFELKTRVESELRIALPARHFLQAPTLATLARAIVDSLQGDAGRGAAKDDPRQVEPRQPVEAGVSDELPRAVRDALPDISNRYDIETCPVSVRQRAIIASALDPAFDPGMRRTLTLAVAVRVKPRIDIDRLRAAASAISRCHKILRATFAVRGNDIVHVFGERDRFTVESIDAQALTEQAFFAQLRDAAFVPADLADGPTWSLQVFHRRQDRDVVLLRIHNVLVDGWSLFRLWIGLIERYVGLDTDNDAATAADYGRFVVWQRHLLQGESGAIKRRFWMDRLAGLPAPPIWVGRSRGAAEAGPLGRRAFHLGDPIARGLDREARGRGTTVFSILLAAFIDALRSVASFDELIVTVGAAGRTHHGIAHVFGLVSNNLHLRLATASIPDFAARAASVNRAVRDALENQEYPSAALEAALLAAGEDTAALGRVEFGQIYPDTLAAHGLEEMMFQLGDTRLSFGGIEVEPLDLPGERIGPEIRLRYQMLAAGLYCRLEYDTDLVGERDAAAVIEAFRARVESFASAHRPSPTPAPSPPAHEYADDGR